MSKDSHEDEFDPVAALLEEVDEAEEETPKPSPPGVHARSLTAADPFQLHPAAAFRTPSTSRPTTPAPTPPASSPASSPTSVRSSSRPPDPFSMHPAAQLRGSVPAPKPPAVPEREEEDNLLASLVEESVAEIRPPPASTPPPPPEPAKASPARNPIPRKPPTPTPRLSPKTLSPPGFFDHRKIEKLTLAGCTLGVGFLLLSLWWTPDETVAPIYSSRAEKLVEELERAFPEEQSTSREARVQAYQEHQRGKPFYQDVLSLASAGLPGRELWLEILKAPQELADAGQGLQNRLQQVLPRLRRLDEFLALAGRAPAYLHSQDPLGCEQEISTRLDGHALTLKRLLERSNRESREPTLEGVTDFLLIFRDTTRTISRRDTGLILEQLLDLLPAYAWSLRLADPEMILGVSPPEPGNVSPRALAFALFHLGRAQEAGSNSRTDQVALLQAAKLLVSGFPTPPSPFGATWASASSLLYAQTGHDAAAIEVATTFCEKAQKSAAALSLGTRLLRRLLTLYGPRSPSKLVELWRSFHDGSPPVADDWWKKLSGGALTPNGLLGQVPRSSRIRGTHTGGDQLSERERALRYQRFKRRRKSRGSRN